MPRGAAPLPTIAALHNRLTILGRLHSGEPKMRALFGKFPMHQQYQTVVSAAGLMASATISSFLCANPAQADETVAYCDLPEYAINVYREHASENDAAAYQMRVFWREKAIVFVDQHADRTVIPEGFVYRNLPMPDDDGLISEDEATWTLFVLNDETLPCFLFKQGALISRGEVTQREAPNPVEP